MKIPVMKLLQNAIGWSRSVTPTRTDGHDKSNSHFFNPNVPKPGRRLQECDEMEGNHLA